MQKIGVIGTGFIAKGLVHLLAKHKTFTLSGILTRTDISKRKDFPESQLLTNSLETLIEASELIVECSGDAIYATDAIAEIIKASIPVVTMNSEFHVTSGSYFIGKGLVTEAEGDQPGSLAALHEDAIAMGFKPLVYGNIKGFLNHNPTLEDMQFWSKKSGISLDMVTSFTDGTKVQIEQALVANGLHASIAKDGLIGLKDDDMLHGGSILAQEAEGLGHPISDYLLSPKLPAGVFIAVAHNSDQKDHLRYYKMGEGPYYVLERPFHLCHMEILKTIQRVLNGGGVLLDNSKTPTVSVASIAKRDLSPGDKIKKAIGSFDVRGEAVTMKEHPGHIPIGLLAHAVIRKEVAKGAILTFDDVEIPKSLALQAWRSIADLIDEE